MSVFGDKKGFATTSLGCKQFVHVPTN